MNDIMHSREIDATTETEPMVRAGNVEDSSIPPRIDCMQGCLHSFFDLTWKHAGFEENIILSFSISSSRLGQKLRYRVGSLLLEVGVGGMPECPRICVLADP